MSGPSCAVLCLAATLTATGATMATPTETALWRATVEMDCIVQCEKRKRRDAEDQVAELQADLALARSLTASVAQPLEHVPIEGWSGLEVLGAGAVGVVLGAVAAVVLALYVDSTQ